MKRGGLKFSTKKNYNSTFINKFSEYFFFLKKKKENITLMPRLHNLDFLTRGHEDHHICIEKNVYNNQELTTPKNHENLHSTCI